MTKYFFFFIIVVFSATKNDDEIVLGKWKLTSADSFINIMSSSRFQQEGMNDKLRLMDIYQKVLDNTYYEFRMDTVLFTNVTPDTIIHKRGRWHINADTLYINDLDKIQTYKLFILNVDEAELEMKFVLPKGGLAKSSLKFRKES